MSLLITAATPDGIVMGVDSALTWTESGETITLSGFPKLTPVRQLHSAISVAGAAKVGLNPSTWISNWLRQFVSGVSSAESFTDFANELVQTLNETPQNPDDSPVLHLAGWVLVQQDDGGTVSVPRVYSIRRQQDGSYHWSSVIPDTMIPELLAWRRDHTLPYPIRFACDGIPSQFADWIASVGTEEFSKLIGGPVPYPDISAVTEYVRFLIRAVAELHRIARRPAFVAEPIEVLTLFPESKNMMATRY